MNEQRAGDSSDDQAGAPDPIRERRKRRLMQRREQERDTDSERVRQQEQRAASDLAAAGGSGEQGPDARAPRSTERDADHERPCRSRHRREVVNQPPFPGEETSHGTDERQAPDSGREGLSIVLLEDEPSARGAAKNTQPPEPVKLLNIEVREVAASS